MFGLNETAVLYVRTGQSGGRPAYAEQGIEFRCRSELGRAWGARGDAVERGTEARIFAQDVEARPGDRIELGGARYLICEVKHMRGTSGVHHLEIAAREDRARR